MGRVRVKTLAALGCLAIGFAGGGPAPAQAADLGPPSQWDEMQKFEYYIGNIAGAMNVCRMYSLHASMRELSVLTPYGQKGLRDWGSYDGIRGAACGGLANDAKAILGDRDKLIDYLKARYDCAGGDCVER